MSNASLPNDGQRDSQASSSKKGAGLRALLSPAKLAFVIGIAGGLAVISWGVVTLTRPLEVSPASQLQAALEQLDEKHDQTARRIAGMLQDQGYQNHDFPGAVAFVLGICAFREANLYDDMARDRRFESAASFLREAKRLSIPDERRPEWAFAYGISLHRIGVADEELLNEAVRTYPPGKHEAGLLLTQVYMESRVKAKMEQALELNRQLLEDATLKAEDRDNAWLQRAQILLALDHREESELALARVSRESAHRHGSAILRAQTQMADGKYREALRDLDPLSRDVGLERNYPAQAQYLMGVCAEKLGELENAVAYYQRTTERFEQSHEALAARVGAAATLQKLGRNEEALENYALVLRSLSSPENFRNRWITLKKLQEATIDAWNSWMEHHYYDEAIALADIMSPLLPREQTLELSARATQRCAQHFEAEVAKLPEDRQTALHDEIETRWKRSGQAHAKLADNRRSIADQYASLWTSAEDFIKGQDFESAIERLNLFVAERTSKLLPAALVRRGQCFMNLGRMNDALRDFQDSISVNPTDPVAFQAQYLVGQCHLECDELDKAELAWRKILESADLTPTAVEWRMALFSMGKLLYDTADRGQRKAGQVVQTGLVVNADQQAAELARFDEAILRLEEFRDRYPMAPETAEDRFLLAMALQKSAKIPESRWKLAETDIARGEFRRQMHERLDRAIKELQVVQGLLLSRQGSGQLDQQGQATLRNCFFEIANCQYLRGRFEAAIAAYSTSAGRYQNEPDSLIAYVQIANSYDHLKKPAEAMSTLAQAQLILKQLPEEAFSNSPSAMSREDWKRWLDWAMKLRN